MEEAKEKSQTDSNGLCSLRRRGVRSVADDATDRPSQMDNQRLVDTANGVRQFSPGLLQPWD